jgi:hypothetical protein
LNWEPEHIISLVSVIVAGLGIWSSTIGRKDDRTAAERLRHQEELRVWRHAAAPTIRQLKDLLFQLTPRMYFNPAPVGRPFTAEELNALIENVWPNYQPLGAHLAEIAVAHPDDAVRIQAQAVADNFSMLRTTMLITERVQDQDGGPEAFLGQVRQYFDGSEDALAALVKVIHGTQSG